MTVEERIKKSSIYSFYVRNPKDLEGTGLDALELIEAFSNAEISFKKVKIIAEVCDYLKSKYTVLCDDEQLGKVVKKAYERICLYLRKETSEIVSVPLGKCCLYTDYEWDEFANNIIYIHSCTHITWMKEFQLRMQGKQRVFLMGIHDLL